MKVPIACCGLLAAAYCLIFVSPALAHEFIIKPTALHAKAGDKIPFSVLSTQVFMSGEELVPAKSVNVSLLEGNKSVDLPLRENNILQTLDGSATLQTKGTVILSGHLLEPIETVNSQETGRPQKVRCEKFSKALIVVDAADKTPVWMVRVEKSTEANAKL